MHGTKADKLYDSTQLLDVKAQLDLGECGMQEVSFYHQHKNNVDFVFVDHPVYHRPGELSSFLVLTILHVLYSWQLTILRKNSYYTRLCRYNQHVTCL